MTIGAGHVVCWPWRCDSRTGQDKPHRAGQTAPGTAPGQDIPHRVPAPGTALPQQAIPRSRRHCAAPRGRHQRRPLAFGGPGRRALGPPGL